MGDGELDINTGPFHSIPGLASTLNFGKNENWNDKFAVFLSIAVIYDNDRGNIYAYRGNKMCLERIKNKLSALLIFESS